MSQAYLVEAVRTPMGKGKPDGSLHGIHPVDLAAVPLKELIRRAGIAPTVIEDVIYGCVTPIHEQGSNIGRLAVLAAGWPITVPGVQINRMCGSSQQAVSFAASSVQAGTYEVCIAAGGESMSRVAMGADGGPLPGSIEDRFEIINQGLSAERIAAKWELTRKQLDQFAVESHSKAAAAQQAGHFQPEIVPVIRSDGTPFEQDETIRPGTNLEKLGTLRTVFQEDGCVTAGTASQITDGAAGLLIASEKGLEKHGLKPRARIVKTAVVGSCPTMMLTGPIPATRAVLDKAGLTLDQIDLFEINEAFAPVVLAWQKDLEVPSEKINVNGGAIALGHPLGGTGARLFTTLLHELERRQVRYGLVTMCIGFGQATATIIERVGA
jgi:acetyl-CoA acetyltransferase family protein